MVHHDAYLGVSIADEAETVIYAICRGRWGDGIAPTRQLRPHPSPAAPIAGRRLELIYAGTTGPVHECLQSIGPLTGATSSKLRSCATVCQPYGGGRGILEIDRIHIRARTEGGDDEQVAYRISCGAIPR